MVDLLLADVAKLQYEERLRQVQGWQISQTGRQANISLVKRLLLSLSKQLIQAGEQLRQRVELQPSAH